MARRKKSKEGHDKQDIEDRKKKKKPAPEPKKKPGSATDQIKETATQGECPVITMSPTAAQMSVPPDASAEDPSVWSTGPGEAVMYHYSRQGQYAEEFASQQAEQSAVPAGVQVMGPGQLCAVRQAEWSAGVSATSGTGTRRTAPRRRCTWRTVRRRTPGGTRCPGR